MIAIGAFLSAAIVVLAIRVTTCVSAIRVEIERCACARALRSQLSQLRRQHGQ